MKAKIDHVTVCGRDLEKMRRAFAEIGLATEYGGAHANGLTHMALVGFEDGSYLELIAPVDAAEQAEMVRASGMMVGWMPLMLGDAGAGAWAIEVRGVHEVAKRLRERGIAVRGPESGGRRRPDGAQLEWETAVLGEGAAGAVLPFLIEDRTKRSLRVQPAAAAGGAGFHGLRAVVIGVHDLARACAMFEQGFEWKASLVEENAEFAARVVRLEDAPVVLAEPLGESWLAERIARFGEGPAAFVLTGNNDAMARRARWFGKNVGWFDEEKLGARLGIVMDGSEAGPSTALG